MMFRSEVEFYITDDEAKLAELRAKAKEVDDHNSGEHLVEYTTEQAFTVAWHDDPDWCHANVLQGWVVNSAGLFRDAETEASDE